MPEKPVALSRGGAARAASARGPVALALSARALQAASVAAMLTLTIGADASPAAELLFKTWYKGCKGKLCAVAMRADSHSSLVIFNDALVPGEFPGTTLVRPDMTPGTNVYWQFGLKTHRVPPIKCSNEFCQAPVILDERFIRGLRQGGMGLFIQVTRNGNVEKTKFSLLEFAHVWDAAPTVPLDELMTWAVPTVTYM